MVRQTLKPWLLDFVQGEIAQVINWKKSLDDPKVKPDPDSRFEDDGSNFRSVASHLPPGTSLQLIKVLSTSGTATGIVSDGHAQAKARLSKDCVEILETEAGEKFGLDTTNDVFEVKEVVVISTPFGPPDGLIHLQIDEIEYSHHLRRIEGQPVPIQQNSDVLQSIDEIYNIRCPRPQPDVAYEADTQGFAPAAVETSDLSNQLPKRHNPGTSATSLVFGGPPRTSAAIHGVENSTFQSQQTFGRRLHEPSLSKDGYQVESGVNLQRPLQATNSLVDDSGGNKLLGLLKKSKAPKVLAHGPLPQVDVEVAVAPEQSPHHGRERNDAGIITVESPNDAIPKPQSQAVPPSAQPREEPTQHSLNSTAKSASVYGRRKIPTIQKKLLDRKDCWVPSLPGQSFPAPSVPMELLLQWNALPPNPTQIPARSGSNVDVGSGKASFEVVSSSEESRPSSQSDQEIPWSSSPPRSPPRLPPDTSPILNVIRGTQDDDLEIAPPHRMPTNRETRPVPTRPRRSPPVGPPNSRPSGPRSRSNSFTRAPCQSSQSYDRRGGDFYRPQNTSTRPRSPRRTVQHGSQRGERDFAPPDSQVSPPVRSHDRTPDDSPAQGFRSTSTTDVASSVVVPHSTSNEMLPPAPRGRAERSQSPLRRGTRKRGSQDQSHTASQPRPNSQPSSQFAIAETPQRSLWPMQPMVGRRSSQSHGSALGRDIPTGPRGLYETPNRFGSRQSSLASLSPPVQPHVDARSQVAATQEPDVEQINGQPTHSEPRLSSERQLDSHLRDVRRERMRDFARQQWIRSNFVLDPSGRDTFDTVFRAYKLHHQADHKEDPTVTKEQLANLIDEAFPDANVPASQMRFTREKGALSTQDQAKREPESKNLTEKRCKEHRQRTRGDGTAWAREKWGTGWRQAYKEYKQARKQRKREKRKALKAARRLEEQPAQPQERKKLRKRREEKKLAKAERLETGKTRKQWQKEQIHARNEARKAKKARELKARQAQEQESSSEYQPSDSGRSSASSHGTG